MSQKLFDSFVIRQTAELADMSKEVRDRVFEEEQRHMLKLHPENLFTRKARMSLLAEAKMRPAQEGGEPRRQASLRFKKSV